jgi:DNA polymerase-4
MDAYYASVEIRERPELRGVPVVVGGSPQSRAVVCSANYLARRFGVRSAMSCAKAQRLCPQAVFLPPRIGLYAEISKQIREIFLSATPLVEPLSLDEAYLDVTQNLLGEPSATRIAMHLKQRIRDELHLSSSAGVGPNKFIAKVASDLKKPDGLVVVSPERVAEFVARLPVDKLWGVGPVTAKRLEQAGLKTTADLRAAPLGDLKAIVGSFAWFLVELAHGRDDRPVTPHHERKSVGAETTLAADSVDAEALEQLTAELADEVAADLRRIGKPGRTVTLKVKYNDFSTISRSRTLATATDDAQTVVQVAVELLKTATELGRRPIRLVGVSMSGLGDLAQGGRQVEVRRSAQMELPLTFSHLWDR